MLSRTSLRNDALLPHSLGKEALAEGIVDLVCASVCEVLSLEVDLGATRAGSQLRCVVEGCGTPDEVTGEGIVGRGECWIVTGNVIGVDEFRKGGHQRLGHELSAVRSKPTGTRGFGGSGFSGGWNCSCHLRQFLSCWPSSQPPSPPQSAEKKMV